MILHLLLHLQGLWLLSQTNFRAGMALFRHTLPVFLLNACVWSSPLLWCATPGQCWHRVLRVHDAPNFQACAVLQIWLYHNVQWWDPMANPAFAIVSPTPEVTCKALITFSRLSPYKSYTAWYHAKAIQQVAKRSVCWSIWRPGDFQGNFFSRICI